MGGMSSSPLRRSFVVLALALWWPAGAYAQDEPGPAEPGSGGAAEQASGPSAAGPRTSSLSWVRMPGAESCISSRALAEAVEARLHRTVFVSAARADVSVEARVSHEEEPPGWHAVIVLSAADGTELGQRELTSEEPSCDALSPLLALVISVMIDPDAQLAPEEPEEPEEPAHPADPEVIVRTERVEVPVVHGWRVELTGGAGAAFGVLPRAAPSLSGSIFFVPPRFLAFEVESVLHPWARASGESPAEGVFLMAQVGALVCPLGWRQEDTSVHACAGVQGGVLRIKESGFSGAVTDERFVAHAVVRGRVAYRLSRYFLAWARLGLLVPLRRLHFRYPDMTGTQRTLFEPWPVGGSLELGLALVFE